MDLLAARALFLSLSLSCQDTAPHVPVSILPPRATLHTEARGKTDWKRIELRQNRKVHKVRKEEEGAAREGGGCGRERERDSDCRGEWNADAGLHKAQKSEHGFHQAVTRINTREQGKEEQYERVQGWIMHQTECEGKGQHQSAQGSQS